jgi:hypothetical protein
MNELETNFFVSMSWHFGGGKSYMSGTAGVGVSRKFDAIQPGVNLAVNFYNGGIGAREDSNMMHFDTVLTAKVTAGSGTGNPMTVYPLHLDSGTGLVDNYKYSATLGANLILNNSNRNQRVGFLQLRAGDFSFQTYNDFGGFKKIGISDGYDRWWTGGGNITVGSRNSEYQLIIASDVFTADTDTENEVDRANARKSLEEFNKQNTGSGFQKLKNKLSDYTPTTASEVDQTFLNASRDGAQWTAEKHSFNLNQGRTSFRMKTPQGQFGLNSLGKGNMYSQDIIHRVINFHLIPSERENYWEFQYTPTINTGF